MGYETYQEGHKLSFQPETANSLDYWQHKLVELGAADGTAKPLATVGNEIGIVTDVLQPGQPDTEVTVHALGKGDKVKVMQSAAIAKNARVMADSANLGQVKAVPGTTGTYRSIGRKVTFGNGASGDIIAIIDVIETIIVP